MYLSYKLFVLWYVLGHYFIWQLAPLFQIALSRGPRVFVQFIAINIRLTTVCSLKEAMEVVSVCSQTHVMSNRHVVHCMSKWVDGKWRSIDRIAIIFNDLGFQKLIRSWRRVKIQACRSVGLIGELCATSITYSISDPSLRNTDLEDPLFQKYRISHLIRRIL
jgi:hypothetical protein